MCQEPWCRDQSGGFAVRLVQRSLGKGWGRRLQHSRVSWFNQHSQLFLPSCCIDINFGALSHVLDPRWYTTAEQRMKDATFRSPSQISLLTDKVINHPTWSWLNRYKSPGVRRLLPWRTKSGDTVIYVTFLSSFSISHSFHQHTLSWQPPMAQERQEILWPQGESRRWRVSCWSQAEGKKEQERQEGPKQKEVNIASHMVCWWLQVILGHSCFPTGTHVASCSRLQQLTVLKLIDWLSWSYFVSRDGAMCEWIWQLQTGRFGLETVICSRVIIADIIRNCSGAIWKIICACCVSTGFESNIFNIYCNLICPLPQTSEPGVKPGRAIRGMSAAVGQGATASENCKPAGADACTSPVHSIQANNNPYFENCFVSNQAVSNPKFVDPYATYPCWWRKPRRWTSWFADVPQVWC